MNNEYLRMQFKRLREALPNREINDPAFGVLCELEEAVGPAPIVDSDPLLTLFNQVKDDLKTRVNDLENRQQRDYALIKEQDQRISKHTRDYDRLAQDIRNLYRTIKKIKKIKKAGKELS